MEKECSVYIDEAGDLGVRRGTQWFVLTAVIVDQEEFLYRRNGATNRYGMKYYTDDMKPDAEYFRSHMVCK